MSDTIYALATAAGRAAVAVVRLSGPQADEALTRLTGRPLPLPRQGVVRRLRTVDGTLLDEALALRFPGPRSFTGEDVVELHLHGGPAVVEGVMDALGALGLRSAGPGEFTRRAFEHGRLDLAQAEAIADLIDAQTASQRRQALEQLGGALGQRFASWRERLLSSLVMIEAAIDFPDEDLPPDVAAGVVNQLIDLRKSLAVALGDLRGEAIRDGYRIALIGAPNAGKSSLFNALIDRDAAIVTATAGTTRDIIEASLVLGGYSVVLADMAGLRLTDDLIEAEGVRRARAWARAANLRLWVVDSTELTSDDEEVADLLQPGDWRVRTKMDLIGTTLAGMTASDASPLFHVSSVAVAGVVGLKAALESHVVAQLSGSEFPAATQQRHRELLTEAIRCLDRGIAGFGRSPEMVGEDIRLAARSLECLSGRIDAEAVLDRVFSTFCIGK